MYGEQTATAGAEEGQILGDVIATTGLPLEQPCAGRGICGLCKVLAEEGVAPPDEVELEHLTAGELALNSRLACRARVAGDARVVLSPIVVYSNKIFRSSNRYLRSQAPIGLAIDLGTTTVAAFLAMLDNGEVCAGSASSQSADRLRRRCHIPAERRHQSGRGPPAVAAARAGVHQPGGRFTAHAAENPGSHPTRHHRRQRGHAPPAHRTPRRRLGEDPVPTLSAPGGQGCQLDDGGASSPTASR